MTQIELKPLKTKTRKDIQNTVRVSFPSITVYKESHNSYTSIVLCIGSNIMEKAGFKNVKKVTLVHDTQKPGSFLVKSNKNGYTIALSPQKTSYKTNFKWILDVPEERKRHVVPYEITEDGIVVHYAKDK